MLSELFKYLTAKNTSTILLFVFLFAVFNTSFSQERETYELDYKATYLMSFRRDSTNVSKENEKVFLSFNDTISVFRSETKYKQDSTRYQYLFGEIKPTGGRISVLGQSKEDNLIVKDGNRITTFENLSIVSKNDINYYYEENKSDFDWEINADTATIKGYLCQNARVTYGNREWSAWFTLEIPVSDGPHRFSGLPGLILKINDSTDSWSFELEELIKIPQNVIVNFDKSIEYMKIQKEDFFVEKKYLLDNIVHLKTGASIDGEHTVRIENLVRRIEEVRQKDNNWIELY